VERFAPRTKFGASVSLERRQQPRNRRATAIGKRVECRETSLGGDQLMRHIERDHRDRDAAV
jgi:hypothetical protein